MEIDETIHCTLVEHNGTKHFSSPRAPWAGTLGLVGLVPPKYIPELCSTAESISNIKYCIGESAS